MLLARLISDTYQGNAAWTGGGVFALLLSGAAWWNARDERDPARKRGGRTLALVFVGFALLALAQILSHPGAWAAE